MIMIVQELFALSRVRRRPTNLFRTSARKGDHAPGTKLKVVEDMMRLR